MNNLEKKIIKPVQYHTDLIRTGLRADRRKLDDARDIKVNVNAIRTASASSVVKIGHTSVVCGCTPKIVSIDGSYGLSELLKIKVELPPICMNPTGFKTFHTEPMVTRVLENILSDSDCIKLDELMIGLGRQYWSIDIEVICLNYDGCLIDAALIAILSSLRTLRLNSNENPDVPDGRINLYSIPLSMTFAVIDESNICDPTFEEEFAAQSTFSITIDAKTNRLCHINKTGGKSITPLTLSECIDRAKKQTQRYSLLSKLD